MTCCTYCGDVTPKEDHTVCNRCTELKILVERTPSPVVARIVKETGQKELDKAIMDILEYWG